MKQIPKEVKAKAVELWANQGLQQALDYVYQEGAKAFSDMIELKDDPLKDDLYRTEGSP